MTNTVAQSLRELADFIESLSDIDLRDQRITLIHYVTTREELAAIARVGSWSKQYDDSFFNIVKDFGNGIELQVYTDRANICRRVVTGQRIVEAVPAQPERIEDIVEWVCDDAVLAQS